MMMMTDLACHRRVERSRKLVTFCTLISFDIQLFGKRLSEKVHAIIPRGIVGGFEIAVLHRNFERMAREAMDYASEC